MVVTYAPLVNVFTRQALDESGLHWSFLSRSCRGRAAHCPVSPAAGCGGGRVLIFTRHAGTGAKDEPAGVFTKNADADYRRHPLDEALVPLCASLGYGLHDVYGCQEFGWLILDGLPLREDISLVAAPQGGDWREVIVGGLPTGDSFPVATNGHLCNLQGKIQRLEASAHHAGI